MAAAEPLLSNIRQLTFPDRFAKAGEGYFSPDGSKVVFQAVPVGSDDGGYQIYVLSLTDGIAEPRMISTGRGTCTCAFFDPSDPDGNRVIFASSHGAPATEAAAGSTSGYQRDGKTYKWDFTPWMNIYATTLGASTPLILTPLTSGPSYSAECAYSPDGRRIVYASNVTGSMELHLLDVASGASRRLTHSNSADVYNGGPFFLDDATVVFRADRERRHFLQLYLIDVDTGAERQLTRDASAGVVNWAPYPHPDGRRVAYTTSRHGTIATRSTCSTLSSRCRSRTSASRTRLGSTACPRSVATAVGFCGRRSGSTRHRVASWPWPISLPRKGRQSTLTTNTS
jgi:Tol biopolymer transport system component